ncbi:hypothetical protein [Hyphomicrobium sp.]|uniref:hypothetical protein n=1 Tax=Hyphomicrobium sp. TaxID=82 RepID=UPI001D777E09|nr:hypothetical protein [Hyphomicrobium sp.]MBY0561514.1 hypothetical protein [Hyphomicrobium sp.]
MNLERLLEVVRDTTEILRDGSTSDHTKLTIVNLDTQTLSSLAQFLKAAAQDALIVGVHQARAVGIKTELLGLLGNREFHFPNNRATARDLANITGSDEIALRLSAVGQALGIWRVEAATYFNGEASKRAAGLTLLVISGFDFNPFATLVS